MERRKEEEGTTSNYMESEAEITLYSIRLWLHVTLTFSTIRLHGDQRIPTLRLCCPILRTQRRHIAVRVGAWLAVAVKAGREEGGVHDWGGQREG